MIVGRKAVRQAVATLMGTVATFVAVYDHETVDFGGKSPVAMVYSDGAMGGPAYKAVGQGKKYALLIALWWRREDGDAVEDYMDDLTDGVLDLLVANRTGADWSDLSIDDQGFSEMDYPLLDGKMYRRETIRVIIW